MTMQASITYHKDRYVIAGDLNFSNVMSLYAQSLIELQQRPEFSFDFTDLKSSDSSGIALVIEWIKLAKASHKPIQFIHLSSDLMNLAKAAGLDLIIDGKV